MHLLAVANKGGITAVAWRVHSPYNHLRSIHQAQGALLDDISSILSRYQ